MPAARTPADPPPDTTAPAEPTAAPAREPGAASSAQSAAASAETVPQSESAGETAPDPEPSNFEYVYPDTTVYQHIPLTAHPASPAVPAREATAAEPAQPARPAVPATVFAFTRPPDGRWQPTDKPVNQARDNDPALTETTGTGA